jgi:dihydrofolate synthase/folylpolyglutamate synthase
VSSTDPLAFLFSLERLGMKFGLENMTRLCAALDHPEQAFASVHVAGTNGKGSVSVMTETALRAAGLRTARYTSPHLVRLEERFVIDGKEVETPRLLAAAARVQQAADALVQRRDLDGWPTFFECATAIAFDLFREAKIEMAVIEVGLGGRLDATNVITPVACAITSIDFDHQAQLGTTIESIAREKAGIIKPGIPVVCGPLPGAAEQVIAKFAHEQGSQVVHAPREVAITPANGMGHVEIRSSRRTLDRVALALRGRHQAENAAVAIALLDVLDGRGWQVPDAAMRDGLSHAVWPGRLEAFRSGDSDILIDAAHNPAGARALAHHLRETGWNDVTLVFGAMQDKDVSAMLGPLAPFCNAMIFTTPDTPRAAPAVELAAIAARLPDAPSQLHVIDPPPAALERAVASGGRVVIAGSIFLIGPLRDILR